MSIAKDIILDELEEQAHPEKVEDVIFWALEYYAKRNVGTWGEIIANSIKQRILDAESATNVDDKAPALGVPDKYK